MSNEFFVTPRRVKKQKQVAKPSEVESKEPQLQTKVKVNKNEIQASRLSREYPKRTFDQYATKKIQIRDEDFDLIKDLCNFIRISKRSIPQGLREKQRITENVILRNLIKIFCDESKKSFKQTDFSKIQTESQVNEYLKKILNF